MAHPEGSTVRVHYRGTLDDGSEFDSSVGREPLEFTIGASQVIPGFESAAAKLAPGESTTITLGFEDAYGGYHDEAVEVVPVTAFTDAPYDGAVVQLLGPSGERLAATITLIEGDDVTLDFNHPLAGKDLTFEIEFVEVVGFAADE